MVDAFYAHPMSTFWALAFAKLGFAKIVDGSKWRILQVFLFFRFKTLFESSQRGKRTHFFSQKGKGEIFDFLLVSFSGRCMSFFGGTWTLRSCIIFVFFRTKCISRSHSKTRLQLSLWKKKKRPRFFSKLSVTRCIKVWTSKKSLFSIVKCGYMVIGAAFLCESIEA